jgi:uncharacterized protein
MLTHSEETTIKNPSLMLSRFVNRFEKDEVFCLLHSLTLRKVYGGQVLKDLYSEFCEPRTVADVVKRLEVEYPESVLGEIIADIRDKGLLVADNEEDVQIYKKLFSDGINLYDIRHMYFLPTSECNFRCKYCFVEDAARKLKPLWMTKETAGKVIDVFAHLTQKADVISMTFYGGEPLLNADVVYSSMRYVRRLEEEEVFKKPVKLSLLTNGSLVDQRTVDVLLETRTSVSVSLDGPEHLHDMARIDAASDATFAAAIAGYRFLQKAGVNPGISCTLSASNVDKIDEVVDFILNELNPPGMGFNILLPPICGGNPSGYSFSFAAAQLVRAFERLREKGIYEDRVMRRVRPYINGGFHLKDCMGVGGQIVATPDGRIGPCQACLGLDDYFPLSVDELHSRLPDISSSDIYAHPLFDEWRHRFPLNMNECIDCPAIAICGGGCPYASFVNHGSIWKVDERVCPQAKTILEWMLWDTYRNF